MPEHSSKRWPPEPVEGPATSWVPELVEGPDEDPNWWIPEGSEASWVPEPVEGPHAGWVPEPVEGPRDPLLFLPRLMLLPYSVLLLLLVWLPGDQASKATGIVNHIARFLAARDVVPYSIGYPILEFFANIALFVPLGLLLAAGWPRLPWWSIALAGLATTLTVEAVQTLLPSRYPSLSDLIANTLGAMIGWSLVAAVRALRRWSRTLGE